MVTVIASEDTYALSDEDYEHGSATVFATIKNASHTGYAYIKFDLSGWAGKTLSEGLIKLNINSNELTSNTTITFKRITGSWDESTLKWSNKPSTTDTNKKTKSLSTSDTGWKTSNITELLQDIIDNSNCCGVFVMLDEGDAAGTVWFNSTEGSSSYRPKLSLTELIVTDFYVSYFTGSDSNPGLSWSSPWQTVNKAATTVPDGSTVHIGVSPTTHVGVYNNEPPGNKIAPQNVGTTGIYYAVEAYDGSGGGGTVSVEQNP